MIENPARCEASDFQAKKTTKIFNQAQKCAKKAKAGISSPANEDFNNKDTSVQSVVAPRHERQRLYK